MSAEPRVSRWSASGLAVILACLAMGGAGCAIRYTDRQGNLTTLGLVWYAIPPPASGARPRPSEPARLQVSFHPEVLPETPLALRQRAVGLIIDATTYRRGVALGFQETLLVLPADDAVTEFSYDSDRPLDARLHVNR